MKTKIQKWGNSLGIRIPKSFAEEAGIGQGSEVDLAVKDGRLVITPQKSKRYHLEDLLSRIKKGNLHTEVDFGVRAGKEAI